MTDYFALFQETRRPWIDPGMLKSKFLAFSAELHPDRVHGESELQNASAARRYAELNAAFACLREPKDRLRHLLELELGSKPKEIHEIPDGLTDLFIEIAQLCRQVKDFLSEKGKASSPLLRVQLFERGQQWAEPLNGLQHRLAGEQEKLLRELETLDAAWVGAGGDPARRRALLARLEEMHRLLGYYARWNSQISEAMVQLIL